MTLRRIAFALFLALLLIGVFMLMDKPRMLPYSSDTALLPPADTEWPYYGLNAGGERYSHLDQINRSNVENLEVAWVYQAGELAAR